MEFSPKKLTAAVIGGVVLLGGALSMSQIVETIDASHVTIIQSPVEGRLDVYTEPGLVGQWFGKVTTYNRRSQFSFSAKKDVGTSADQSVDVTFNDGGHAHISGQVSWEMPVDKKQAARIHKEYGSQQAIEQQLIRPAIERALYLTAPLMSSTESYSARRAEFLAAFEDQARNGIYRTETVQTRQPDPISGVEKTVSITRIVKGADGQPVRQVSSPLADFGIVLLSPTIDGMKYDDTVQKQITQQQQAVAEIQTAQARAREAEQRAITAEKNGQADAATAKWKQETIKAQAVTEAQQAKEVAELNANRDRQVAVTAAERDRQVAELARQAADFTKQTQVLLGEGEAARKKLVMEADGALEKKLEAYVASQRLWADAFANMKTPVVPSVVMGGQLGQGGSAQTMMDMLAVKAAKDLSLDMSTAMPKK